MSVVQDAEIIAGPLRVDRYAHVARLNDRVLDLTPRDFALLEVMAREPHRCWTPADLQHSMDWYISDESIRKAVSTLRLKLGPDFLETQWGVGYRLFPVRR